MSALDRDFWQGTARGVILYQCCGACGHVQYQARPFCAGCLSRDLVWKEASGRGRVASLTTVYRAPDETFARLAPYVIALIDMEEGFRMMAMMANGIGIGETVQAGFVAVGDRHLPRFKRP